MEPAIGYIRVSSDEQVEGFSLDAQEERIRAYAKSQDYQILEIYRDDGYSAKNLERPSVQKLLQEVPRNKFKIILVYKLDRLTRRLKDLTDILEYFTKHEVKFESVTEAFETKTAPGRLMLNVLGGFAQFEREVNAERVLSSLRRRFDEGRWMTSPPYGYSMVEGSLIVNSAEAPLVKRVYQMYLNENIGTKEIAIKLNQEGLTTQKGHKWRTGGIYRILTYPAYSGYTVWQGMKKKGIHEGLVDEETYKIVQKRLKEKNRLPSRNYTTRNIFTGLIFCGKCGSSMFGQKPGTKGKEKYRYYVCSNTYIYHSCSQGYIDSNLLEEKIFKKIRQISSNPDLIKDYIERYKENQNRERIVLKDKIAKFKQQIGQLKTKGEGIVDWLTNTLPDGEIAKRTNQKLKELTEKKVKLEEELLQAETQLSNLNLDEITAEIVSGYLNLFDYYYERFTVSQRKLLVEAVIKRINVNSKEEIKVDMILPLVPLGIKQENSSCFYPSWRDLRSETRNQLIFTFVVSLL